MIRRIPSRRKRRRESRPILIETKWGWWPCIDYGWCAVPAALVRHAFGLGITPEEGWLFVQLLDMKWGEGQMTLQLLSERFGNTPEHVYQILQHLQSRGFVRIIPKRSRRTLSSERGGSGDLHPLTGMELDLAPLIHVLSDYIMKDGDLSAGFLRLSPASHEGHTPPTTEDPASA